MKSIATLAVLWDLICSAPLPAAETLRSGSFDSAGVPIAYLLTGSGQAVVLIHGLHASAELNWQLPGTMKRLAGRYQVVALDVRGHGRSGKPAAADAYGLQMVEDVVRLMDHLHIEKAHVVGYSMGGMIALKLVAEHPQRVLSGTLGGMGWLREGSALQEFWARLPSREGARTPAACVRSIAKLAVSEEQIRAIRVPVAVIVGDRDPVEKLYVAPLSRLRNDWPVVQIQGAGHISCIFKGQFQDELERWLDKNARP